MVGNQPGAAGVIGPEVAARALRNLRVCSYVETPQFAADRINAALGATAGILPDQPNIIAAAD
jgi:hypothetical protein